jgi:hypothetical protein
MRYATINLTLVLTITLALAFASTGLGEFVIIFDEDAKDEAANGDWSAIFVSHDAGSTVTVTDDESISGEVSAFCTPSQSYNPTVSGWQYSIDDYPFITFAWKKDGGTGIMVQFAHDNAWAYRYFSGVNVTNWAGIQLEDDIPDEWMVYTRNWEDDFGGGWNLTGIALTPWDGAGGYYDHIMIHSEEHEGEIAQQAVEPVSKLATTWAGVKR